MQFLLCKCTAPDKMVAGGGRVHVCRCVLVYLTGGHGHNLKGLYSCRGGECGKLTLSIIIASGCVQVHPTQRAHLVGVSKCTQPKEHIKWVCPSAPNPKSTSSVCVQVHPTQRAHLVGVSKCTQPKEHIKWVCPSAPNPKSTSIRHVRVVHHAC